MNGIGRDPKWVRLFRAPIGGTGLARAVKGNESFFDWQEGRPVMEWTKGRGGLEQEDWARYYARSCSPAIGYCLDAGGCQLVGASQERAIHSPKSTLNQQPEVCQSC